MPIHVMCKTNITLTTKIGDMSFQANTFDSHRDQQGFFTFQHKWVIVTKQPSQLNDIELFLGNVSNVVALVPSAVSFPVHQVLS